jgi:hypothetical protein
MNDTSRRVTALTLLFIGGCAPAREHVSPAAWLLLVPPITTDGIVDAKQPLSEWRPAWNFGNRLDCDTFLQNQQFEVHTRYGPLTTAPGQTLEQIEALQILEGQCVAHDDPRLAYYPNP